MHNNIQEQLDRTLQGIELEIIKPENILIVAPEWLEVDSETQAALNLQDTLKYLELNKGV